MKEGDLIKKTMKTRLLYIMYALLVVMAMQAQRYKMVMYLSNGMKMEQFVEDIDSIVWVEAEIDNDDDDPDEPTATGEAKDVDIYSATLTARVRNMADVNDADMSVGVIYCTDGAPASNNGNIEMVSMTNVEADGTYSVDVTGLSPATTYCYCSFISMGDTYMYGKVRNFTTIGQGISFTTGTAQNITSYSAAVSSAMTIEEGVAYESLSYGICYGNTDMPTINDGKVVAKSRDANGKYTLNFMGLAADTIYYYRPYAVMDGFVSYGAMSAFRTSADNILETGEMIQQDGYNVTSVLSMGAGVYTALKVGICYSRKENPTVEDFNVAATGVDADGNFMVKLPLTVDTWYYRAYAVINGMPHYGDIKQFIVESSDTREAVDLGLSVKWASCNVGATAPTEYGDYFAWGITTGYNEGATMYNWANYGYCNGGYNKLTKYCTSSEYGKKDDLTRLEDDDDAAIINWGAKWRVPTEGEIAELREKCTWRKYSKGNVKYNGVAGYEVTGTNGNSIFLPAAGYRYNGSLRSAETYGRYWANSISDDNPSKAKCYDFTTGSITSQFRYYGFSIRPVSAE